MSKWDKLLSRVLAMDKDMRFEELRTILEHYGYVLHSPRSGSSHCTFRKEGCDPITIPRSNPIKIAYIQMVRRIVEKEIKDESD